MIIYHHHHHHHYLLFKLNYRLPLLSSFLDSAPMLLNQFQAIIGFIRHHSFNVKPLYRNKFKRHLQFLPKRKIFLNLAIYIFRLVYCNIKERLARAFHTELDRVLSTLARGANLLMMKMTITMTLLKAIWSGSNLKTEAKMTILEFDKKQFGETFQMSDLVYELDLSYSLHISRQVPSHVFSL